ncbi:VanZ family protein [Apibacter sp. HY039]|uniref:VanZ family protein n=1 Tax=Apibacter sp. HY039 TaxID=2501476 RepID=UPI000FEB82E5|nr:VanZ family protein [Apibacter sp. HY039]
MPKNIKNWLDKYQPKIKIVFLIYFFVLAWLLLRPSGNGGLFSEFSYNDKLVHAVTFFLLTLLACLSFPKIHSLIFLFIFTVYGIIIEFLQEYMNMGRSFEYSDMFADFVGCLLALIPIYIIKR